MDESTRNPENTMIEKMTTMGVNQTMEQRCAQSRKQNSFGVLWVFHQFAFSSQSNSLW
jgi:hypothetical protein